MKELTQAINKWLLSKFHVCEYEMIGESITKIKDGDGVVFKVIQTYTQRCRTCGKIKSKNIIHQD